MGLHRADDRHLHLHTRHSSLLLSSSPHTIRVRSDLLSSYDGSSCSTTSSSRSLDDKEASGIDAHLPAGQSLSLPGT